MIGWDDESIVISVMLKDSFKEPRSTTMCRALVGPITFVFLRSKIRLVKCMYGREKGRRSEYLVGESVLHQ